MYTPYLIVLTFKLNPMKTINLSLLLLLLSIISTDINANKTDKDKGKNTFYSEQGKFKIYFPAEPTLEMSNLRTDKGLAKMFMFSCKKNETTYLVTYIDYPEGFITNKNKTKLIRNTGHGFLNSLSMGTTKTDWLKLEEERVFYFEGNNDVNYAKGQILANQNRLYQVIILKDEPITFEEVYTFIQTFELVK